MVTNKNREEIFELAKMVEPRISTEGIIKLCDGLERRWPIDPVPRVKSSGQLGSPKWFQEVAMAGKFIFCRDFLIIMRYFQENRNKNPYFCEGYLGQVGLRLEEKGLSHISTTREHDVHTFLRMPNQSLDKQFLHLQAYPGLSQPISEDSKVVVSAYIQGTTTDNDPSTNMLFQNQYPWVDMEYETVLNDLEDELKLGV